MQVRRRSPSAYAKRCSRTDYITSTHRGHGHCVAKGAALDRMFAELLGKEAGYCKGKGGSMHIADPDTGNLGANAIVAGSTAIATGAAFSAKRLGNGRVAVCFFGDGALGQGLLYESMNMAAIWKLPVIYVCENNLYNEYTPMAEVTAGDIQTRGPAFGVPSNRVDGQDVQAVYHAAKEMIDRARRGEGPGYLVADTYRYHGHHIGDINREYYRSKAEEAKWKRTRSDQAVRCMDDFQGHCRQGRGRQDRRRGDGRSGSGRRFRRQGPVSRVQMR